MCRRFLFLAILLFASNFGGVEPSFARSQDSLEYLYKKYVIPEYSAYQQCGIVHFRQLAKKESRSFDAVEGTVASVCGFHIDSVRSKLTIMGISRRGDQNKLIGDAYEKIGPVFRETYETARAGIILGEALQGLQDERMQKAVACSQAAVTVYGLTNKDGAETIALAAFHKCRPEWQATVDAAYGQGQLLQTGMTRNDYNELTRKIAVEQLTQMVIDVRARAVLQSDDDETHPASEQEARKSW